MSSRDRRVVLAVTDTETTGTSELDQVCELAIVLLEPAITAKRRASSRWSTSRWSSLIKPTCPMSLEARATHHITDKELAGAPHVPEFLRSRGLPEYGRDPLDEETDVILVAHNEPFDRRMMLQSGFPAEILPERSICTWRCGQHLCPDAPRHTNQVLRYYLDVEPIVIPGLPPHRALADALVTAAILEKFLLSSSVEDLIQLTSKKPVLRSVPFGKRRGEPWSSMDEGFLRWVLSRDFNDDVRHTAEHWLRQKSGDVLRPASGR